MSHDPTKHAIGSIACVVGQYCALMWYAASYIPYGRACLRGAATGLCKCVWRRCKAEAEG